MSILGGQLVPGGGLCVGGGWVVPQHSWSVTCGRARLQAETQVPLGVWPIGTASAPTEGKVNSSFGKKGRFIEEVASELAFEGWVGVPQAEVGDGVPGRRQSTQG